MSAPRSRGSAGAQDVPRPVGVRLLRGADDHADVPMYRGVSYCDAVRRAGTGESLRVLPGSIEVCRWAPVVLGLNPPQGRFETHLAPRLRAPVAGLLLSPLERFPGDPEVVLVRTTAGATRRAVQRLDPGELWQAHGGRLDRSALPFLASSSRAHGDTQQIRNIIAIRPAVGWRSNLRRRPGWRLLRSQTPLARNDQFPGDPADETGLSLSQLRLMAAVNHALATLAPLPGWQALTRWLFRSRLVTISFDALISRALPDMSMCRNTTVVPLLTGRVNASFFCTGGITWGRNQPDHLVSGWPLPQFRRVADNLLPGGPDG